MLALGIRFEASAWHESCALVIESGEEEPRNLLKVGLVTFVSCALGCGQDTNDRTLNLRGPPALHGSDWKDVVV